MLSNGWEILAKIGYNLKFCNQSWEYTRGVTEDNNEYCLAIVFCTVAVHSIMCIVVAIQLLNSLLILSNKN